MTDGQRRFWASVAAALICIAAVIGAVLDQKDDSSDRVIRDVKVEGKEVQIDSGNTQDRDERQEAKTPASSPYATPDIHEDARDENLPGVDEAEENKRKQNLLEKQEQLKGDPAIIGGAQVHSCAYRPVVNQSGRGNAKILAFVLHYTVSANRPGTSDIYAIRGLFNRPSFGASSHYVMDFDGNCIQIVPERAKSWTQGFLNPWSVSVEIIATGRETRAEWLNSRMIKNGHLSSLARDVLGRHGLRLARGSTNGNCTYRVSGWVDHNQLPCNNHTDVQPNFPYAEFQRQLTQGVRGSRPPTKQAINQCKTLTRIRRLKEPTLAQRRTRVQIKKNLTRRDYKCTTKNGRAYIYRR